MQIYLMATQYMYVDKLNHKIPICANLAKLDSKSSPPN